MNTPAAHCIQPESAVDFEVANFATNQRLFSIYDGPSYQESNAYLDVVPTPLPDLASQCQPTQGNSCPGAMKLYGRLFFYPPAFHSQNLSSTTRPSAISSSCRNSAPGRSTPIRRG